MGVEGITISPGYSYSLAPQQDVFMGRRESKELFRDIFRRGRENGRRWRFNQSSLFLDFLAGNRDYRCTPWSNPTYNVFGWQRPCYLLVEEGYASSFAELMEKPSGSATAPAAIPSATTAWPTAATRERRSTIRSVIRSRHCRLPVAAPQPRRRWCPTHRSSIWIAATVSCR